MNCIETQNLVHRFSGNENTLEKICLQVPEGAVYGFLGANGAGKTTTLKLILGLLKKQQGTISVFGKDLQKHRVEILSKTGSMIESPSLYGHLTATENLEALRRIYRCSGSRITEVLKLTGLESTGSKKTRNFSLGMKQRLAIAMAMLHDPELLILDEPVNGLDPNGIIEVRELLRQLNREKGTTILVSSHLLAEIEKMVTHTGIISNGKLVFQGTLDELMHKQRSAFVTLDTNDNSKALNIIKAFEPSAAAYQNRLSFTFSTREKIADINRILLQHNINVYEIATEKTDLETIFMNLTNN